MVTYAWRVTVPLARGTLPGFMGNRDILVSRRVRQKTFLKKVTIREFSMDAKLPCLRTDIEVTPRMNEVTPRMNERVKSSVPRVYEQE